ncbi:hypothetical protein HGA88_00980 [Candidatus Roizmanbacteria bacterium]|nr:hypothetical protein [Candidatus Roizmanbacteria bacterium]
MKKTNNPHPTNFWFGFAMGGVFATLASYFLGTKTGRQKAREILDYAEKIELNPEELMELIQSLQITPTESSEDSKEPEAKNALANIDSIIDKMKSMTQTNKKVKKFFVKGGKVVNSDE